MKNFKIISIFVIALMGLSLVSAVFAASKKSREITYYLISLSEKPNYIAFGCGEFLVPVTKTVKKADLKTVLKEFFKAQAKTPHYYVGYESGSNDGPYGLDYFALKKVMEPKKPTEKNPIRVYLKEKGKYQRGGLCDDPRTVEPLSETIKHYMESKGNPPYKIFLNESESQWRCFSDESGLCK